jgi:hypothetical protein
MSLLASGSVWDSLFVIRPVSFVIMDRMSFFGLAHNVLACWLIAY